MWKQQLSLVTLATNLETFVDESPSPWTTVWILESYKSSAVCDGTHVGVSSAFFVCLQVDENNTGKDTQMAINWN